MWYFIVFLAGFAAGILLRNKAVADAQEAEAWVKKEFAALKAEHDKLVAKIKEKAGH